MVCMLGPSVLLSFSMNRGGGLGSALGCEHRCSASSSAEVVMGAAVNGGASSGVEGRMRCSESQRFLLDHLDLSLYSRRPHVRNVLKTESKEGGWMIFGRRVCG